MADTFVQIPGFMAVGINTQNPSVSGVDPADGTLLASVTTRPAVYFSESMQASTINASTVTLIDLLGNPIAQAAGSPALSVDRRTATIIPAAPLRFLTNYRVRVKGGDSGVKNLSNEGLIATYTQLLGFTTAADTIGPPRVARVEPPSLAVGVPINVRPVVTFSEPVNRVTVTATSVLLLAPNGTAVPQAPGSPSLSSDGVTATIIPAANLAYDTNYRVRVMGGTNGVKDLAGESLPGTYTQASGFVTVDPSTSPIEGNIHVTPGATDAEIVWSTAAPTSARVYYRRSSAVTYQTPVDDPNLASGHAIRITGLSPATEYSFFIESRDADGNVVDTADMQFTTDSNDYTYLVMEVERGRLTTPVRSGSDVTAFQGGFAETPSTAATGSAAAPAGSAQLSFYAPEAGSWSVWVRLFGASPASGGWFEAVDGAERRQIVPARINQWDWVLARSYDLAEGSHVLELGGYERESRADRVLITNDAAFEPNETPDLDVTPPSAALGLSAVPGSSANTLRWTNPVGDATSVIVRYRTDGLFPANPADGHLAVARPAEATTAETFQHSGLSNGVTYRYSVFLLDDARNVSAAAVVQAAPRP
jgi:hypothetical protein